MQPQAFRRENNTLIPCTADAERWLQGVSGRVWVKAVSESRKRSLDQNALMWAIYGEVGQFMGLSVEEAHRYCKLHYGVPILRRDSDEFRRVYDACLKKLLYEQKLKAVMMISVSSIMTTKQAKEYIEDIVRDFSEKGLVIDLPDD
jgi:hypothetical protein